ncbi:MAG: nucleotide exchange factor GrpE [Planctomycetota bacterium]
MNQDPLDPAEYPDPADLSDPAEGIEEIDAAEAEATGEEMALLNQLQEERDDLEQRLMRVSADYQNFARRAAHNVESAAQQKLMDIARALVTVLDHFDRALEADPETTSAQDLLGGVTIVKNELLAALGRFGIERLEVGPGDEFDPNRHEALMRQPSEDVQANHVTMQLQPGYTLGDKVVRPAQVSVAE